MVFNYFESHSFGDEVGLSRDQKISAPESGMQSSLGILPLAVKGAQGMSSVSALAPLARISPEGILDGDME